MKKTTKKTATKTALQIAEAAITPAYDPRLVALHRAQVESLRYRVEIVADRVTVALGLLHAATTLGTDYDDTLPGSSATCAGDMHRSASRALHEAATECWWLSRLPAEVLDGPAPTDDQREKLEAQGFAADDLRRVMVAEAARLRASDAEYAALDRVRGVR